MTDAGTFYMPDPDLFGHADAYSLFTTYAASLEEAGLASRFPDDAEIRKIAIELLAERYALEDVEENESFIDNAVAEALIISEERRSKNS
jgi:hypothetical protein